ncbi:stage V sporulation protein K [Alteribacter natronophilus]|uniref:stage V sporulation protein K n=1 Tax=Alteribacter natronophilus TaxID=2583810 RepID=UPI00110ECFAF|nr:stage V sporulation protein K [Alteribacter natronophilus]TMW73295.1 stage V sporulation protein K [Alteribacter natronophilus]
MHHADSSIRKKGQINIVLKKQQENADAGSYGGLPLTDEVHAPFRQVEKSLSSLVGLGEMKTFMKEVYAWIYLNKKRQEAGLSANKQTLHMVFKGNPGTGKTTVARIVAGMLKEMEVLEKGHLIEAERADLVGEYIGHTAQKTRELIKKAMGGILFIDEAYSLARGGEKDFGKEAIDTLVKAMEDQQHDFVLILAGYPREMDRFLALNPGLPSRFPLKVDFPDYSVSELSQIAGRMLETWQYRLNGQAAEQLKKILYNEKNREGAHFSNGRFIRNVLEKAIRHQAVRLLEADDYGRESLQVLMAEDLVKSYNKLNSG